MHNSSWTGKRTRRLLPAVLVATGLLTGGFAAIASADHPGRAAKLAAPGNTMRVGPNYELLPNADPIYGRDGVGLAVNPSDPKHIVALYTDLVSLHCEVATSFDGGQKWRRVRLKAPPGFSNPPCVIGSHLGAHVDGGIAFGKGNTVYTSWATGLIDEKTGQGKGQSALVSRSDDGGKSFGTGIVALQGGDDADVGPDFNLPKLVVEPGKGSGADRLFVVANSVEQPKPGSPLQPGQAPGRQDDITVTSSKDGGKTWAGGQKADPPGQSAVEASQPVLGKGGALYVAWRTRNTGPRPGTFGPEGSLIVGKTTDGGANWSRTTAAGVRGFVYNGPPQPLYATNRAFTQSTFPRLVGDRKSGNIYLVYGNGGPPTPQGKAVASDHFIDKDMDVYFQRSTDGGQVWSDPAKLNREPAIQYETSQTRHPNVSLAPNGRLDVVWQDRRHWYLGTNVRDGSGICTNTHVECAEGRLGDTYYRSSKDGGASFSAERRITDRSMNNDVGFDYRFGSYWDYGPQSVPLGNDKILFAWMDSRPGNVETDTMGLELAQADLVASRQIPVQKVKRTGVSDLSVQMSKLAYPAGPEATLTGTFATKPSSRVVIVSDRDLAGALAGGVLGRANLGSVLVTPAGGLSPAVKAELTRLAPVGAYLIGSTGSLSEQVAADVAATGVPQDGIVRLTGNDAAGTAAAIATTMDRRSDQQKRDGLRAFDAAVIVNPASPDAAAVSVLAANRRLPVLLTNADGLPPATDAALKQLNITQTIVIGDETAVGSQVLAQLPKAQRLSGKDAVATSRAIVGESRRRGLPTNVVFSTRATRRMDAAVIGAAAGRIGGLLLLSPGGAREAAKQLDGLKMRSMVDHLIMVDRP